MSAKCIFLISISAALGHRSSMARVAFPLLWAFGALVFGLAAVSFVPLQHAFTQVIAKFAVNLPYGHTSHPIVLDHSRDIRYVGSLSSYGVEHFQNIFYAEDPSGPRRFSAPVPTKPDRGSVIDATQPGAWCPQATGDVLPFTSRVTNISENCLSLRVARPQGTQASAKLPVMVWVHGGEPWLLFDCSGRTELIIHPTKCRGPRAWLGIRGALPAGRPRITSCCRRPAVDFCGHQLPFGM